MRPLATATSATVSSDSAALVRRASPLCLLSVCLRRRRRPPLIWGFSPSDEADAEFQRYLSLAAGSGGSVLETQRAYTSLGIFYQERVQTATEETPPLRRAEWLNQAETYYRKSLELVQQTGVPEPEQIGLVADANLHLGNVHELRGDPNQAIKLYEVALRLYGSAKASKMAMARVYSSLGFAHLRTRSFKDCIENFTRNLEICEEQKDPRALSSAHSEVGDAYFQFCEYSKAVDHFEKSLQIARRYFAADRAEVERLESNVNVSREAAELAQEVGTLERKLGRSGSLSADKTFEILRDIYSKLTVMNNPDKLLLCARKLVACAGEINDAGKKLDAHACLGEALLRTEKWQEAAKVFQEMLSTLRTQPQKDAELEADALGGLGRALSKLHMYAN